MQCLLCNTVKYHNSLWGSIKICQNTECRPAPLIVHGDDGFSSQE